MSVALRILVVDDDPDIRTIARLSLSLDAGITVAVAGSADEAIAILRADGACDAILLDVMMPAMDGPALAVAIRELPGCAETPILFMTARARPADIALYRSLGAAGVIVKPFDPLNLAQTVRAGIQPPVSFGYGTK